RGSSAADPGRPSDPGNGRTPARMNRPHARDGWPQTTTTDNMIQSVKRHTTLKKPGERWQLDGTQPVVLDVRNDCVTLGLAAEAAVLHRPTRRSPRSRFSGASARSGAFW